MSNFWLGLKTPFFDQAPMEDVTDTVFRELILSISSGDILKIMFAEFTSTDGLLNPRGYDQVAKRLFVSEAEKELQYPQRLL